jgi:2-polyprenyl-3-methyl-5-hydroxy-6-metoxy-1,4-benzoquinol methylase
LGIVFDTIFKDLRAEEKLLIEIGAGGSEWLPVISEAYGFRVYGLDYSEEGCMRARKNLKETKLKGEIICSDMFNPPKTLLNKFDVVCSFGLVEHFTDTTAAINACAKYLKPKGIIVTLIPNMTGLNGFFYKLLNKDVFNTHVPLTLNQLSQSHKNANLDVYFEWYLLGLPGIIDKDRNESEFTRKIFRKIVHFLTKSIWWWEEKGIGIPENPLTSPYMICVAKSK